MKFITAFCLLGLSLSLGQAFLSMPSAEPARWARIPHASLFKPVPVEDTAVIVSSSPDVALAIRGADPFPGKPSACCERVADAVAY
jgi:hypothetical protein